LVFHTSTWVINSIHTRTLVIHTRKWLFHTRKWFIHTRKWVIRTRKWVVHKGIEWFIHDLIFKKSSTHKNHTHLYERLTFSQNPKNRAGKIRARNGHFLLGNWAPGNFQFLDILSLWVFVSKKCTRVNPQTFMTQVNPNLAVFWPDALCTVVPRLFHQYVRGGVGRCVKGGWNGSFDFYRSYPHSRTSNALRRWFRVKWMCVFNMVCVQVVDRGWINQYHMLSWIPKGINNIVIFLH
jgi:hypothetical protein